MWATNTSDKLTEEIPVSGFACLKCHVIFNGIVTMKEVPLLTLDW